jgi:penicillin-binding protein 2
MIHLERTLMPSRFTWLLLMLLFAGCSALPGQTAQNNSAGEVQLVAQSPSLSPEDVVRGFMDAWNAGDLTRMYSFVSLPSREIYPYAVFERRYQQVAEKINLQGITYTLYETRLQGTSAALTYDVELASPRFGTIVDDDRIMRLVQSADGWQIAWSPLDILDGLAADVQIEVISRFLPRGNIYDRDGDLVVEQGGTIVSVYIIQQDMRDVDECITLLAEVFQRRRTDIVTLFGDYNAESFFHVGEIDPEVYARYRNDLEAICAIADTSAGYQKVQQYQERAYVGHGAAAHITGYIGRMPGDQVAYWTGKGYQEGDIVGISGIEFAYEEQLAGKPERYLRLLEPGGATLRELAGTQGSSPIPVQLTIDMGLQNAVAQAISDAYNYAGNNWATVANGAAAVVMKVDTGEILALASYPSYDPSLFNPESSYINASTFIERIVNNPRRPLANKAVQEQYTPGSVYKIFTLAAVAAENVFQPGELFSCDLEWYGQERFGDSLEFRQDWRVADEMDAAGEITMSEALTTSCNPFFWEMGAIMFRRDAAMQARYSGMFGFGQRTGFGLIAPEAPGNVASPQVITQAINNAIGQGDVQTTALQMAVAVTAVANRGTVFQPYIIKQIGGLGGTELQQAFEPRIASQLNLPASVYDIIWDGMCQVPYNEDLGTAWRVFGGNDVFPPYTTCGKTGTAEAGARDSGIPPNAWYVSFSPAENPEIVTVVVVPNSREGSEVAAPITRRILDYYFDAPQAPFPEWWEGEYVPLKVPEGVSG